MTEIQWLVDIMLNNKLSEPVKQKFIARIGEVESQLSKFPSKPQMTFTPTPIMAGQALSTQRAMENHIAADPTLTQTIAATPQAAQALAERQKAIGIAASGQTEKGRTSPRKF